MSQYGLMINFLAAESPLSKKQLMIALFRAGCVFFLLVVANELNFSTVQTRVNLLQIVQNKYTQCP